MESFDSNLTRDADATTGMVPESPILLSNDEGLLKLREILTHSQGVAIAVVHPFYYEHGDFDWTKYTPEYRARYDEYIQRLPKAMEEYKKRGQPIILFEEERALPDLNQTLQKLGLAAKEVFLIITRDGHSELATGVLYMLACKLHAFGLRKAVVAGSNMWLENPGRLSMSIDIPGRPPITRRYRVKGCVGYVIDDFLDSGIYAIPAAASFPREPSQKGKI